MPIYSGQDPEPAPEGADIAVAGHGGFGAMLGAEAVNTFTEGVARIPRMMELANAAAGDAAGDALKPTIVVLQKSAADLVDRMIAAT